MRPEDLGPAINVRARFGPERAALLETLERLGPAEWRAATACPGWSVHDVAAHVIGDDVGRLARTRDGHAGVSPGEGEDLPTFLDRINQEWVVATRRMSPELLVDALRWYGAQIAEMWAAADVVALGEPVSWAGPDPAPVWLDAARDHSEYWVHHQQVREAVGLPVRLDAPSAGVVVDTFLRALPHTVRMVERPAGTRLTVEATGAQGGLWTVERTADTWCRVAADALADSRVTMDVDTVWRLCTRSIDPEEAARRAEVLGDRQLGQAALTILSIIRRGDHMLL